MESFLRDIIDIAHQPYIALIIIAALAFDFINGFHDAANSIATIVGTRVLRPLQAVVWAAWWNFAAMWFFGFHVANAVAKWVHVEYVNPDVILAGLVGAIVWNLITWYAGLPSSSSHALLGGLIGSAATHAMKFQGVFYEDKVWKTVEFIVIAPLVGLALGLLLTGIVMWTFRKTTAIKVDRWFRVVQLGSAAAYSLGHGTNDAQKTMGVIAALLYAGVWNKEQQAAFSAGHFPYWIALACFMTIAAGTMSGGWRIVKTMGMRITKLRPYDGACAEVAAATSLFASTALGVPVSTTHTITGAIVGVGAVQRLSAVRWGVARQVVWAWVLTIPCSAVVASLVYWLLKLVRP
jgi:inorganic phosphate transporter, PiT family